MLFTNKKKKLYKQIYLYGYIECCFVFYICDCWNLKYNMIYNNNRSIMYQIIYFVGN